MAVEVKRHGLQNGEFLVLQTVGYGSGMQEANCPGCGHSIGGLPGYEAGRVIKVDVNNSPVYRTGSEWAHLDCAGRMFDQAVRDSGPAWTTGTQREMVLFIHDVSPKTVIVDYEGSRGRDQRYRWRLGDG